jgi:hypothetical protein
MVSMENYCEIEGVVKVILVSFVTILIRYAIWFCEHKARICPSEFDF